MSTPDESISLPTPPGGTFWRVTGSSNSGRLELVRDGVAVADSVIDYRFLPGHTHDLEELTAIVIQDADDMLSSYRYGPLLGMTGYNFAGRRY